MPIWNKLSFQDRNSPLIEHLLFFHDHSITILVLIVSIIIYIIYITIIAKNFNRFIIESQNMELFWTSIPSLILVFIAIPSLKTLYLIEENLKPLINIKTLGYQWYWSYEYFNNIEKNYNSILIKNLSIRLIDTSNHLIIPIKTSIQIIISSKDVIHSWTISSMGIKVDAIPGRINQINFILNRPRIILGQCSEICGAGHSFIPILIESISLKKFLKII